MKRTPRICLISNPDSIHVQRWERHFSTRGFDVSLLSFYQPQTEPSSEASLHYLRPRSTAPSSGRARAATAAQRFPGLLRLFTAARYRAAGFYRELDRINPDLVHAHYVSDYGFLAALSRRRPLIVSAWGSDVLVDPGLSPITRQLVRGVLGVDGDLLDALRTRTIPPATRQPVILSLRSLDRTLYNVDVIIEAMPEVLVRVPNARLLIGNEGSLKPLLEEQARR